MQTQGFVAEELVDVVYSGEFGERDDALGVGESTLEKGKAGAPRVLG